MAATVQLFLGPRRHARGRDGYQPSGRHGAAACRRLLLGQGRAEFAGLGRAALDAYGFAGARATTFADPPRSGPIATRRALPTSEKPGATILAREIRNRIGHGAMMPSAKKLPAIADMEAVILCGGMGTRLREETEYRPKPMVEIGGKPILAHYEIL